MTHAELIDRVTAIIVNSDRAPRARAEEVVRVAIDWWAPPPFAPLDKQQEWLDENRPEFLNRAEDQIG